MKTVRTCVVVVGLVVVFVVALGVCNRLRDAHGEQTVAVIACALGAAWAATKESREMARKVVRSIERIVWSLKEAAIRADMDFAQLSRQLNGVEQMSLSRYAAWGQTWAVAFAQELAADTGAIVIAQDELREIVVTLRPLVDREVRA
jgi:hypothetical protein